MIVRSPVVTRSRPRRVRARPRPRTPAVFVALALLALVAAAAALLLTNGDPSDATGGEQGGGGGESEPVQLAGVASYDPFGDDGAEHPELVAEATDGDPSTYWTTSTYQSFTQTKEGVGLVVDAGSATVELSSVTVDTDTPGFTAEIRAGDAQGGPFEQVVGASRTAGGRTTWELEGDAARYYVVWITALDGRAHLNEVSAR